MKSKLIHLLAVLALSLGVPAFAQSVAPSPVTEPNISFPAFTPITATGVTSSAIVLSTATQGLLQVTGTFSTVTFAVQGSIDGGVTYFPLSVAVYNVPGTLAATNTATTAQLYSVNLAGYNRVRVVTSGTFTGTSAIFKLTISPHRGQV